MGRIALLIIFFTGIVFYAPANGNITDEAIEGKIIGLIEKMTLDEKIGQLIQKNAGSFSDSLIMAGGVGSILNEVDVSIQNHIQKLSVESSRLGIPILFARDVIHGFKTIMPIPLAMAATWNTDLVEDCSRISAIEASSSGIRWTFSPMVDVTRDPRWGRISEGFGEDTYLTSEMGAAMVRGYQNSPDSKTRIASCVKHFAAYGWAEGGRDYNSANISDYDLKEIVLPPFKKCASEGAMTFMCSFNDLNGIPATGNEFLLKNILRDEWGYNGLLVSDWVSISQLVTHGFTENNQEAAKLAFNATVDMDMASPVYEKNLKNLLKEGIITIEQINEAVKRILRVKFQLGLFENPYTNSADFPEMLNEKNLKISKKAAIESAVLLKNDGNLPINKKVKTIAVIGPLADAPHDQLGTWIMDGNKKNSVTPLASISKKANELGIKVLYSRGLKLSRSKEILNEKEVIKTAKSADLVLLFLGEESILSGESHCRADIGLPGAQEDLVRLVSENCNNISTIIMAGRPLTFEYILDKTGSVLFAMHGGTMAGEAISDLLFGIESPSGKLPVTFPRHVGQIPIYYNHRITGKPANNSTWQKIDDIPAEAPQLSIGNTSHYLDYGFEPMFPFGFGLSYTSFDYSNLKIENDKITLEGTLKVSVDVSNTGKYDGNEVVQLYIRDLFASRVRPVKELKDFQKVFLSEGKKQTVTFEIPVSELGFYGTDLKYIVEQGEFQLWVGGDSTRGLISKFTVIK
ncbi:MAG: beta-glucosidase BglX [Prolixibacteraceae bacterium]|nr:beta-glucosidase BglX [Prolixibacteraceae bacterium]